MLRTTTDPPKLVRCAIYTRKSTEEGLQQEFNTLDAQRASAEAFIASQQSEGWVCLPEHYDDGGFTGGNLDRPALKRLRADIEAGKVDAVLVYKVDRLSRSIRDFHRLMDDLDKHHVAFVSVTQQFNTATSMGRLTLNMLLSFAQFEREMISERTRDKIAAARRRGKWSGGMPVLGFDVDDHGKLIVNAAEAVLVLGIFELYLQHRSLVAVLKELEARGWKSKQWTTRKGTVRGGRPFDKDTLYRLLTNVVYRGQVRYKTEIHPGEQEAIVPADLWQRVQTLLQRNRHGGGATARNRYGALLRGLLHCSACQCAMMHAYTAKGTKRYRYYVCMQAQKRGWHTCPSKSIPAGQIEKFVVDQIRAIGRDPALVAATLQQVQRQLALGIQELDSEKVVLERTLKTPERQVARVLARGGDAAELAALEEQIQKTQQRITTITQEKARRQQETLDQKMMAEALAKFEPVWESLTPREQARLLELLIARVDYDGKLGQVRITFHASGIKTLAQDTVVPTQEQAA